MGLLYDGVAAGMWAYSRAAFRVTVLGPRRFRFRPGTLILVTHRHETDVPIICPPLFYGAGLIRNRAPHERMSFAARDDMFLPGFFAGFPPELPPLARKLLFRLDVGRWLPVVQVFPIRSASVARLGEVLRQRGEEPLPADELGPFARRAAALGLEAPVRASDALRAEYADLLWRAVTPRDRVSAGLDGFWSARAAQAAADFRRLVDIVRVGGTLLVFPEGRPSPDGEIGPIQRGLSALVRRGRPSAFLPVALAYDPLVRGRPRVFVSIGEFTEPPGGNAEAAALELLRRTMPLTAGQIAAAGVDGDDAVRTALDAGRPVEPDLLDAERRTARLAEAAEAARSRPADLPFLANEYRSARV